MPRNGSVGLNGRARLCEDTYTNRPGEVVAASSTAAALEAAWAVRSAGTLTLSSADDGFVVREVNAESASSFYQAEVVFAEASLPDETLQADCFFTAVTRIAEPINTGMVTVDEKSGDRPRRGWWV